MLELLWQSSHYAWFCYWRLIVLQVQEWVAQNGGFNSVAQLSEIGMSQKQVDNFLKRNVVVELTQITA